ncbi:hypothetical protein BDV12DRAFT_198935 [Aspergillus spectabilis]
MSKIITVVGATGTQGGSVIRALLANLHTNPRYTIRAITRNPQSTAAKALASQGIEVISADLSDISSLTAAFKGTHAIFAVTNFFENLATLGVAGAMENETRLGINLANAAAATESLEHYIWSTLPDSNKKSGGKAPVPYYESKTRVNEYIRTLPDLLRKTTFAWFGWYAGNMQFPIYHPASVPTFDGSKSYLTFLNVDPATKVPLLGDEKVNTGLFVKAILEQHEKTLPGKTVAGVMEYRTLGDVLAAFAKAKGIQAHVLQISREDYRALWPVWADALDLSHLYLEVAGEEAFSGDGEEVLTAGDLGVEGLIGVEAAFEGVELLT